MPSDYGLGQLITGIVSVGLQVYQIWKDTRDVGKVQAKAKQFKKITTSLQTARQGRQLENLVPKRVLTTLKNRIDICWSDFQYAMENPNILPRQMDKYTEGLRECICRELRIILRVNVRFPTKQMQKWWNEYGCEDLNS